MTVAAASPLFDAVVRYALDGISVFPCLQKIPLTGPGGFKNATLDAEKILEWWTDNPEAQIGIPTGEINHLFVIDIDGPNGDAALAKMKLPETFTVETRPGRHQLWFRQPDGVKTRCSAGVLAPEVDTRGDGGYIVAPPSIHHLTGKPYQVVKDLPWAPAPLELLNANARSEPEPTPNGIPQGSRRPKLFRLACKMRREGLEVAAIYEALKAIPCAPPLPEVELRKLAAGTTRYDAEPSRRFSGQMETAAEVELLYYANIEREQVRWLWP